MGFVRKITGAQAQADATLKAADEQAVATRQAADETAKASREAAAQTSRQQEQVAARNAAEGAAVDAVSAPLENPDVQINTTNDSAAGRARKRRAAFGVGSTGTGVTI